MAKSFKQLPASKAEHSKPTSEKDIFDFLEEEKIVPKKAANQEVNSVSNTSNTSNRQSADVTNDTGVTHVTDTVVAVAADTPDVRQTFIIGQQYLDRLKDYVHTRRRQGQYDYTQKQALHEALDALFAQATIEPRPEHIRQLEENRKQKIRRGISR